MNLDIQQSRSDRKYPIKEQINPIFWMVDKMLFRLTPLLCYGFRRFILRCFGVSIGKHVHIYSTIQIYFPWKLSIGNWRDINIQPQAEPFNKAFHLSKNERTQIRQNGRKLEKKNTALKQWHSK